MQATLTAFDFKSMPDKKFNNLRLPRHTSNVTLAGRLVEGLIFAYASTENSVFSRTYAGIGREVNVAPSTVAVAMKRLKNCGRITSSAQSVYTYSRPTAPKKYEHGVFGGINFFVCPEILYKESFYIRGNVRALTKSEVAIASLVITLAIRDNNRDVKLSVRDIERELGICRQTVLTSLKNLVYSGILSLGKSDKGTNRNKKTTWHLNRALFANVRKWLYRKPAPEKTTPKADKPVPAPYNVQSRDKIIARESWYAQRREDAERRADAVFKRAMKDVEFKSIESTLGSLYRKVAFAELQNSELFATLDAQRIALEKQKEQVLKRLNLTEDDFKPHYHCTECNDTGFDAHGKPCHCYESSVLKN